VNDEGVALEHFALPLLEWIRCRVIHMTQKESEAYTVA
jgi:hypothetical protein